MSVKLLCLFTLLFSGAVVFAQTKFVDSIDKTPIPFVHIISDGGTIIGTTNIDGMIDFRSIPALKDGYVSFQHISYQSQEFQVNQMFNIDTIQLTPKNILIPEIVVKNKSEPVYLVLKGYFRSYQIENGVPKYYTDGIVEYYMAKNQLKNHVVQYRSFRNKELVEAEKTRVNTIRMVVAGVPYINAKTELEELDDEYTLEWHENRKLIERESSTVGFIYLNKSAGRVEVNIDLIAPALEKERSLFNYTSKIRSINITGNYTSADIGNIKKEDLISRKEYRKILFKHKKEPDFTEIDVLHEFYVFDRYYLYKSDLKGLDLSGNFSFQESSNYATEYWKDLGKHYIEKLPDNIERLLGTKLESY